MMRPNVTIATAPISVRKPAAKTQMAGSLARWHQQVQSSFAAQVLLFAVSTVALFAMYLALNWPHFGVNARLHWDAEISICTTDPMPNQAELQENRGHIYDIVKEIHSSDPATVTAYFNSYKSSSEHLPLEKVRRYYSQISFIVARVSFNLGKKWFGSPLGAVLVFQITAMIAVSVAMALLLMFAIVITPAGDQLPIRLGMLVLAFTAIATQIIFLSIARQVLTETIGLLFWIPTLLLLSAAIQPQRSRWLAAVFAAGFGAGLFATIRTRYNLGPAVLLVLPLVVMVSVPIAQLRWRWKRYVLLSGIAAAVFIGLVAIDARVYGPFFMPWVYDQTLVRSASLYFHSDPPYALFLVMVYNNFPLLLLPVMGVFAAFCNRTTRPLIRIYAAIALGVLALLIVMMGRQAVGYQGRHLFALSAAAVLILFLTLGRVRWGRVGVCCFATACVVVIIFNLHSTFGPQRLILGQVGRPVTRENFGVRWARQKNKALLLADLFNGYFEWADDDRLHDPLLALQLIHASSSGTKPLLVIAGNVEKGKRIESLANQFSMADVCWMADQVDVTNTRIAAALKAGTPVYIFTSNVVPAYVNALHAIPEPLALEHSALLHVKPKAAI